MRKIVPLVTLTAFVALVALATLPPTSVAAAAPGRHRSLVRPTPSRRRSIRRSAH